MLLYPASYTRSFKAPETGSILVSNSQISHKLCHTLHLTFNYVSAGSNVSNLSFTWITPAPESTQSLISTDRSHVDAQSRLSVMTISPMCRCCHLVCFLLEHQRPKQFRIWIGICEALGCASSQTCNWTSVEMLFFIWRRYQFRSRI
jgi:hypothetical protein